MSPSSSVATPTDVVVSPGLVTEDLSLKLAQLRARLDAELVDETGAGSLIHVQSLRLPARTVQRDHELAQEALPQRVLGDEPFELADDVAVATELEIGVDALRKSGETELVQPPDLRLREVLERELRERRSPPQLERAHEMLASLLRREAARVRERALEPVRVDLLGRNAEDVSGGSCLEYVRPQHLSELTDAVLKRCHRRLGRTLAPEEVDEPIRRHDTARRERENGEQRALPLTAERNRSGLVRDLERPRVSGDRASRATLGHRTSSCPARPYESRQRSGPAQECRLARCW